MIGSQENINRNGIAPIFLGLILLTFLFALIVLYFVCCAVVSGVANLVAGADAEPSPGFGERLGEVLPW